MKKRLRAPIVALAVALFASAAPAEATFTILGPFPIMNTTFGVPSVPLVPPTTNSPAPWIFTSSNPKVATIAGKVIMIVGAGTSTITASQAAIGTYTARSRSTQIRVSQGTPVLGAFIAQSIPITQRTYTLTPPTSTSNGGWSFRSTNPLVATVDGTKVTFHDGGITTIYADQAPTFNWKAASTSMTFTVVAIAPVLGSFGDITIMKNSVGSLNLIPPTSNSPGKWTFSLSNPSVASLVGSTITPLAFGVTTVTASQAAIGDFASAVAKMTLTINGPMPTVGVFPDTTAQIPALSSITLYQPSSNSTGAWSYVSADPTIASINGNVAYLHKPGVVTITANQAPTNIYGSPAPISMKLTIVGTPVLGAWADIQKVVKDPDFTLVPPTSASPGGWSYSSSNPLIADVVNGVVTVKGSGETTITATQAATPLWQSATTKMTLRVYGAIPTLGTFAPIEATLGDSPVTIKAPTSNSTGTWTYTSSNKNVATVSGSTLTVVGVGSATIFATQAPAGIYSQSNTVQAAITVKAKATPTPKPTATSKPTTTPSPKATVTSKPTPKPTAAPNPTPTPTPVNATVGASAAGRVITVVAIGVKALAWINGKPAKIGKNTVKPGPVTVIITINDHVVYRKLFAIK